jgi:hypothetical protein
MPTPAVIVYSIPFSASSGGQSPVGLLESKK